MAKRLRKLPASTTDRADREPLRAALEKTGSWVADKARDLLRQSKAAMQARVAFFELRKRLDMNQQELANRLGISLRTITRYESEGAPISLSMLSKMTRLAKDTGHADLAAKMEHSFQEIFKMRLGAELILPDLDEDRNDLERLRELLRSFRDLWNVFQPEINEAEQRIRRRLDELLSEMAKLLLPEKENA